MRCLGQALLVTALVALGACGGEPGLDPAELNAGLQRATDWLVAGQDPDGAWRSRTYGNMKDGASLTPPVLKALVFPESGAERAIARGLAGLAAREPGSEDAPHLDYPVYTSALAVLLLSRDPTAAERESRERWLAFLDTWQLDEDLGWRPEDPAYGGFGYALRPPRRPAPGEPAPDFEADISSTLFALGAMRLAGREPEHPAIQKGLRLVERCQNLPLGDAPADPELDDGGFFFSPTNPLQNKAGESAVDASGRQRYRSYGTATADGLRALLRCGLGPEHPRVRAALAWLGRNWSVDHVPGAYAPARLGDRDAPWFYWCWTFAHAMRALGLVELQTPAGPRAWAPELARAVLARQRPDGSFANTNGFVREDDPLVATPFACAVLALSGLCLPP